jgi:hypothetical protein
MSIWFHVYMIAIIAAILFGVDALEKHLMQIISLLKNWHPNPP